MLTDRQYGRGALIGNDIALYVPIDMEAAGKMQVTTDLCLLPDDGINPAPADLPFPRPSICILPDSGTQAGHKALLNWLKRILPRGSD
jgi:hypothetical protein